MPPKKILIVDDEQMITGALSILFKQAGYGVLIAHSGTEALDQLPAYPDLIVLDLMLPGIDGYEVCREIRHYSPTVPVLMLTALDETRNKVAGLDVGADAYFTKPFEPAELLAQVRALLRRSDQAAPADEDLLCCGSLRLCASQHRVDVDGKEVELTPKEYELLRLFLRKPGTVFGRETLLREIWGYEFAGDTRTVDVHIQRLRAKIETGPAQSPRLSTVRGFGYRLVANETR